jgi:hypothetical protein
LFAGPSTKYRGCCFGPTSLWNIDCIQGGSGDVRRVRVYTVVAIGKMTLGDGPLKTRLSLDVMTDLLSNTFEWEVKISA